MPNLKLYGIIALVLMLVWGVYKIAKLASFKGQRKERDRAKADEEKKVAELAERLNDGHDINDHLVRDK